ncbi:MAG: hypothetical protein A4E63_00113 [Syntrophorhabdus sp. PtaU1.Bin050]|nr:MAG: hypothetical protein A4E63_00113 [Syntrophorhabdus sp. PtaU1.Bin050]
MNSGDGSVLFSQVLFFFLLENGKLHFEVRQFFPCLFCFHEPSRLIVQRRDLAFYTSHLVIQAAFRGQYLPSFLLERRQGVALATKLGQFLDESFILWVLFSGQPLEFRLISRDCLLRPTRIDQKGTRTGTRGIATVLGKPLNLGLQVSDGAFGFVDGMLPGQLPFLEFLFLVLDELLYGLNLRDPPVEIYILLVT